MLKLILVRHGTRQRARNKHLDPRTGLTSEARREAEKATARLATLIGAAHAIRSSQHVHSQETARILSQSLPNRPNVELAPFLTPAVAAPRSYDLEHRLARRRGTCEACEIRDSQIRSDEHWADDGADGALRPAVENQQQVVEVWVGHETRLSQLVLRYTGQRERQLEALEAICLTIESQADLLTGRGKIAWRYPVANWLEKDIKQKLQSKMVAATFLASANFVALLEILVSKPGESNLGLKSAFQLAQTAAVPGASKDHVAPLLDAAKQYAATNDASPMLREAVAAVEGATAHLPPLALGCFVAAAALFMSTVYLYDRLAMPEGFWTQKPFRTWNPFRTHDKKHAELVRLHGSPYHHMIRIWGCFFTVGVLLSFLGIALLVLTYVHPLGVAGFFGLSGAAYLAYSLARPTGDVD